MSYDPCHKCGRPSFKTDGESRSWCEACLGLNLDTRNRYTYIKPNRKLQNNDTCSCGSGKKYKHCCK